MLSAGVATDAQLTAFFGRGVIVYAIRAGVKVDIHHLRPSISSPREAALHKLRPNVMAAIHRNTQVVETKIMFMASFLGCGF